MTESATDLKHLPDFLKTVPDNTKVYIGCDSERVNKKGVWYADYCIVVVVHKAGCKGCKIFGQIVRERDYEQKQDRPSFRLMNEVYKVSQYYLENFDLFEGFKPEIHIDINPDEEHGSSCVINQAVGYVKGVCGITPKVKPEAFSASYAADRFAYIYNKTNRKNARRERRKENKKS